MPCSLVHFVEGVYFFTFPKFRAKFKTLKFMKTRVDFDKINQVGFLKIKTIEEHMSKMLFCFQNLNC